ncbi:hypothetical protein GGR54DRAFT_640720 [Hypoxylon sp. NC1633]|nr:hypothetical protein GGR54DRAFT_640720 [Hypoxylon sp. NC1633]
MDLRIRTYPQTKLPRGTLRKRLSRTISIYHPGYSSFEPLLSLNASDDGGVHYTVAYYACCVITGNKWADSEGRPVEGRPAGRANNDAFLSKTAEPNPINVPGDNILREKRYYFHVPGYADNRYPLVPCFEFWKFPDTLPAPWRSLKSESDSDNDSSENAGSETNSAHTRRALNYHDEACRVTGDLNGLDMCHLVAKTCGRWFERNAMRDYSESDIPRNDPLNETPNLLPLRTDIHRFVDRSHIVMIPKQTDPTTNSYTLVTHVIQPPGKSIDGNLEMIVRYHNLQIHHLPRNPIEFLFAQFAWSLFNDKIFRFFKSTLIRQENIPLLSFETLNDGKTRFVNQMGINGDFPTPRAGNRRSGGDTDAQGNNGNGNPQDDDGAPGDSHGTKGYRDEDNESLDSFDPDNYDAYIEKAFSGYGGFSDSDSHQSLDSRPSKRARSMSWGSDGSSSSGDSGPALPEKPHTSVQAVPDLSSSVLSIDSGYKSVNSEIAMNMKKGKKF